MKKKIIVLSLLALIIAACFLPVSQQESISIKSPFLNLYRQLIAPANWCRWRADLKKSFITDSARIIIKKDKASFSILYHNQALQVGINENVFTVSDRWAHGSKYTYTLIPENDLKKTSILVNEKRSAAGYLASKLGFAWTEDNHIAELKKFMETDSLLYGCTIARTTVTDSNLIVIDRAVLARNKYTQAAQMLAELQQYLKTHNVKQMSPIIAQFLPKGQDSSMVKVGIFVDQVIKPENEISYARMPKGGTFYISGFKGRFSDRSKVYTGMHQYFANHLYQLALIPFERYLDNKLPVSDTDKVNIQVVFPSYF